MGQCCQPALSADEQLILGQARLLDEAMKENQKNDAVVKKILLLGLCALLWSTILTT